MIAEISPQQRGTRVSRRVAIQDAFASVTNEVIRHFKPNSPPSPTGQEPAVSGISRRQLLVAAGAVGIEAGLEAAGLRVLFTPSQAFAGGDVTSNSISNQPLAPLTPEQQADYLGGEKKWRNRLEEIRQKPEWRQSNIPPVRELGQQRETPHFTFRFTTRPGRHTADIILLEQYARTLEMVYSQSQRWGFRLPAKRVTVWLMDTSNGAPSEYTPDGYLILPNTATLYGTFTGRGLPAHEFIHVIQAEYDANGNKQPPNMSESSVHESQAESLRRAYADGPGSEPPRLDPARSPVTTQYDSVLFWEYLMHLGELEFSDRMFLIRSGFESSRALNPRTPTSDIFLEGLREALPRVRNGKTFNAVLREFAVFQLLAKHAPNADRLLPTATFRALKKNAAFVDPVKGRADIRENPQVTFTIGQNTRQGEVSLRGLGASAAFAVTTNGRSNFAIRLERQTSQTLLLNVVAVRGNMVEITVVESASRNDQEILYTYDAPEGVKEFYLVVTAGAKLDPNSDINREEIAHKGTLTVERVPRRSVSPTK